MVREQARRINELEAADNRCGQELDVIHADRRDLIQSLQKRDCISTDMEKGLTKRVDRHCQVLNRLEDGLETLGVKQDSLLLEIERLSGQVCHCGECGSASETSQLSYASPPLAGASSASSAGYEDAEDQGGEEGGEGDVPLVVMSSLDPIRIPGPVVRGQRAVRSSGVIRSLKSDQAQTGPYFQRGGRIVGRTCEFIKALADVVASRGRRHTGSSSLPPSSLSRGSLGEDRTTSSGSGDDSNGVPALPFIYNCHRRCGAYPGWGGHTLGARVSAPTWNIVNTL